MPGPCSASAAHSTSLTKVGPSVSAPVSHWLDRPRHGARCRCRRKPDSTGGPFLAPGDAGLPQVAGTGLLGQEAENYVACRRFPKQRSGCQPSTSCPTMRGRVSEPLQNTAVYSSYRAPQGDRIASCELWETCHPRACALISCPASPSFRAVYTPLWLYLKAPDLLSARALVRRAAALLSTARHVGRLACPRPLAPPAPASHHHTLRCRFCNIVRC